MNRKKTIICMVLCIAVLLLAVGYAAFATKLKISSKGNITSNWNIFFSSISSSATGQAYNIETPSVTGTTANFRTGLKLPGDKMVYTIVIKNGGTVNAIINEIKITSNSSTKVTYNVSGLTKGYKLAKSTEKTFTVTVELDSNITSLPEESIGSINLSIEVVQDTGQTVPSETPNIEVKRLNSLILKNNTAQPDTSINFSQVSSDTNGKGLYYTNKNTENGATTYYFRGAVENNYVSFAGFIWRIIRINEDESIRLIKQDSIGTSAFNVSGDNAYIGYMYGIPEAEMSKYGDIDGDGIIGIKDRTLIKRMIASGTGVSTSDRSSFFADINLDNQITAVDEELLVQLINGRSITEIFANIQPTLRYNRTHYNLTDSTIKTVIDGWYSTNLIGYSSYLADSGFCGDRSVANGTGIGTTDTNYGAYDRLFTKISPQFKCPQTNDLYTTKTSTKGNKALDYPIGLITADEVAYAGSIYARLDESGNINYYLSYSNIFLTMTPSRKESISLVPTNGGLYGGSVINEGSVRPVINLKATTTVKSGTGTATDPYVINN